MVIFYLGVGTGSAGAPDNLGQDLTVLRGKLLRIDVETGDPATYTIPPSNPYVGNPNARPEIGPLEYAIRGVRLLIGRPAIITSPMLDKRCVKKWMFSRRAAPAAPITAGTSWKEVCVLILILATGTGLTLPVAEYDHTEGCSITGGTVYRAARYPTFGGIYFYGDWCSGKIWGLQQMNGSWQNSFLSGSNLALIAFCEDEDGYLWAADYSGGAIYSVVEGPPTPVTCRLRKRSLPTPRRSASVDVHASHHKQQYRCRQLAWWLTTIGQLVFHSCRSHQIRALAAGLATTA